MLSRLIKSFFESMKPLCARERPPRRLANYPDLASAQRDYDQFFEWSESRFKWFDTAQVRSTVYADFLDIDREEYAAWLKLGYALKRKQ